MMPWCFEGSYIESSIYVEIGIYNVNLEIHDSLKDNNNIFLLLQLHVKLTTLLCLSKLLASFNPKREIGTRIELTMLAEGIRVLNSQKTCNPAKDTLNFHSASSMECT